MARHTLYAYVNGPDLDEVANQVEAAIEALVALGTRKNRGSSTRSTRAKSLRCIVWSTASTSFNFGIGGKPGSARILAQKFPLRAAR